MSLQNHGGLTTTEVATARKPLIHTAPIPGCENYNAEYFETRKMSLKCENIEETVSKTKYLLENENLQNGMTKNQEKNVNKDTCDKITNVILNGLK